MEDKKRIELIDYLKAVCVIMVIITHYDWADKTSPFFSMVINMAVPVFMILTGYNFAMSNQKKTDGKIQSMYQWQVLKSKLARFLIPFIVVCFVEIILLMVDGREINPFRIFVMGAYGPGSYYVPVMLQLLVLFPFIYAMVSKNAKLGLTLAAIFNLLFEIMIHITALDKYYYRLLVGRYLLLVAFGCYLYLHPRSRVKRWQMLLMLAVGFTYIYTSFYVEREPVLFSYWTPTAMPVSFYIFPIVVLLFRKFYHCTIPGSVGSVLTEIGKASYHIFLVQMVYYHFNLGFVAMEFPMGISVAANIVLCVCIGCSFYEAENMFLNWWKKERSMRLQKKFTTGMVMLCLCLLFQGGIQVWAAENGNLDPEYWKEKKVQEVYSIGESDIDATGALTAENYVHNTRYNTENIYDVIDVSVYQGTIDWNKVKASGVENAFLRVGFRGYGDAGTLVEDTSFKTNLKNARNAGVSVGIYIYSQAITEAEAIEEAKFAISRVKTYELGLPVVIDYEYASVRGGLGGRLYQAGLSRTQMTDICEAFCDTVKNGAFVPMIYANRNMLETKLNSAELESKYKIWLAEYNTTARYKGFYEFWQYSERGTVDGISGLVDTNFWYKGAALNLGDQSKVTKPGKVTITSAVNKSGKKVSLKWKKVKGVSGYQICYATNSKFSSSKKTTVKSSSTSKSITKLKKNKTYYFKVRAYSLDKEGNKVYGSYGSVKKVKIKK